MPDLDTPLVVYGAPWCPDCRRSKAFLSEQRVPFTFIDLEEHPEENTTVERYNDGKRIIPTIVFPDGSILVEPSDEELASRLGLSRDAAQTSYDLVIVGGGPTGLTTAIYAARENLRTVWWSPLPQLIGQAAVIDTYVNQDLTAVTVEFHLDIIAPACTLRVIDRFTVDGEGRITTQENFFDPRDVMNLGWRDGSA